MTATAASPAGLATGGLPPWAREGRDLVPGVPARVIALAEQLDAMAEGMTGTQRLVSGLDGAGWAGQAAAGFARLMVSLSAPYGRGAPSMREAADQVRGHAGVLAAAQRDADEALALDRRARAMRSTPGSTSGGIVPPAAADALQRRAVEQVDQARARVRASGAAAAAALDRASATAPDQPNAIVRLLHRAVSVERSFELGVVESTVDTVRFATMLSPSRALVDPSGWWRDVRATGQGLGTAVVHPLDTAKAVADLDTLSSDPGRWVGHLLPGVLLGAATGGTGMVASRGASVGVRMAEAALRGGRRADLRAGIDAGTAIGRSQLRLRDLRPWNHVDEHGRPHSLTPGQNMATAGLARDARWAEHDLRSRVVTVGRSTGSDVVGLDHAVKGTTSLRRKISGEVTQRPLDQVLPSVNDTVRYALVPAHKAYARAVHPIIDGLGQQGMVLVKVKNFWDSPRYRGINLTLADPRTGRLIEVQVHTPGSWRANKATHEDYEHFRVLDDAHPLKQVLSDRIARTFGVVPEPPGLRDLDGQLKNLVTTPVRNRTPELLSLQVAPQDLAVAAAVGAAGAGGDHLAATSPGSTDQLSVRLVARDPTTGDERGPSLSFADGRRTGRHLEHGGTGRPAGGQP